MRGAYESRLVLLALLVVLLPAGWAVRPQALSLLLLVVALQLAIRDRLEWLAPMMVIWANAHGVVLFGVLIAIGAAVDAVVWSHDRRRRAVVVAVLCVAAPLVSPLGWHYWPRVAQTVSESRLVGIQEFRSGFELSALPFWGLFVALGVAVVRRARTLGRLDKADRQMAMLALVLGVASVISIRNAPFFALVAAPALSRLTSSSARQARRRPAGVGAHRPARVGCGSGGNRCRARVAGRWGAIGMAARQPNGGACDPIVPGADVQHLLRRRDRSCGLRPNNECSSTEGWRCIPFLSWSAAAERICLVSTSNCLPTTGSDARSSRPTRPWPRHCVGISLPNVCTPIRNGRCSSSSRHAVDLSRPVASSLSCSVLSAPGDARQCRLTIDAPICEVDG